MKSIFIQNKIWNPRKANRNIVGRMYSVSVAQGELYYLRLLLLHVRGATSFEHLRSIDGIVCETYKEAATKLQLLADDSQWESFLMDAVALQMPYLLREAFAIVCVFGEPTNALALWDQFKDDFCEDYTRIHGGVLAEQYALRDIQEILLIHRKKNSDFGLPDPSDDLENLAYNMLDLEALASEADELIAKLNLAQRQAFDAIVDACSQENLQRRCFFLDGPGGSGKTFLYNTLTKYIQSKGSSVISVASTGLAATELEGGTTYHSRFGLGINTCETTTSKIKSNSKAGKELRNAALIIWDEITMTPSYNMNAVDRLLRDITNVDLPFGNKVLVIGGDFRQTLPIVRQEGRVQIVQSSIKYSQSWRHFRKFTLHQNMRTVNGSDQHNNWLIRLGNGELSNDHDLGEDIIEVPQKFIVNDDLTSAVFGTSIDPTKTDELGELAILTPKNEHVHKLNNKIIVSITGQARIYQSRDSIVSDEQEDYPVEFLNSGMPLHNLQLKVAAIVMLVRNLNPKRSLCNGTRLIIRELRDHIIVAEILRGKHKGQIAMIPRIDVLPAEGELPFMLKRRQFPIMLAFAMTINKSQGQSLNKVGIYLPAPVCSHGHLYVAFSQGRISENIKLKILPTSTQGQLVESVEKYFTVNCVYKEIFQ